MNQYLQIAKGLVLLAFLGVCGYVVWNYNHMSAQVEQIAPLQAQVEALQKGQAAMTQELITRADLDAAIRARRQEVTIRLDKATQDDPQVRAYLTERIPDGVRRAYTGAPGRDPVPAADAH